MYFVLILQEHVSVDRVRMVLHLVANAQSQSAPLKLTELRHALVDIYINDEMHTVHYYLISPHKTTNMSSVHILV